MLEGRIKININCLRRNAHHNAHLQKAWLQFGESAFIVCIICKSKTLNGAQRREEIEIAKGNCYNINVCATSRRGTKNSMSTIAKQRRAAKERIKTKNGRAQIRSLQKGDAKIKADAAKIIFRATPEGKQQLARARIKRWCARAARIKSRLHWKKYWSDPDNRKARSAMMKRIWAARRKACA